MLAFISMLTLWHSFLNLSLMYCGPQSAIIIDGSPYTIDLREFFVYGIG